MTPGGYGFAGLVVGVLILATSLLGLTVLLGAAIAAVGLRCIGHINRAADMRRYTTDPTTGRKISGWGIDYDRSHNDSTRR